jgi:hypothetical protein
VVPGAANPINIHHNRNLRMINTLFRICNLIQNLRHESFYLSATT